MTPRDCLLRYPLTSLLRDRQRDFWLSLGQEMTFAVGETLFQEGVRGTWAYLLLEGRVRMLRHAPDDREISIGTIKPGELFGEYALLEPYNNTATCRVADTATVLRLPLPELRAAVGESSEVSQCLKAFLRLHSLLRIMRGQSSWGFMSASSAVRYLGNLQPVTYPKGRSIQAKGLADDRWFVIDSGQVEVYSPAGTVKTIGPGDSFGERALIGEHDVQGLRAVSDTRCQYLLRSDFVPLHTASVLYGQTFQAKRTSDQAYPWVGQTGEADCGWAAVAMVAQKCQVKVSLEELRRILAFSERGLSLRDVNRLSACAGLAGQAVNLGIEQLGAVSLPAIAHWSDGHYVVIFEHCGNGLVIGDPATGIIRMSVDEFARHWSGILLLLHKR